MNKNLFNKGGAMRKNVAAMTVILLLAAVTILFAHEDITQSPGCKYCGMDREKFGHSRMHIAYEDGTTVGTCSLHCTAVELALAIDKTPIAIMVGDFGTRKLVDAEKAAWVIGGSKPGVMTMRAKWAFENKSDADVFMKENGGKRATFDEAIRLAYEDLYLDTRMIREKRKMKKKGAMEHEHH
jgi:copper chaperone NosL